jgi:cytochrome c oxidase cbb3-type subunit 3
VRWPLVVVACAACETGGAAPSQVPPAPGSGAPAPATVDDAPASYKKLCAPCHGPAGKGYVADHAPSLVNPTFLETATDAFIGDSIAAGRPGTSMAAYSKDRGGPLDATGIAELVRWLRAKGQALKRLDDVRAGDPRRGGPLYVKHCLKCHGNPRTRGEAIHLANAVFLEQAKDPFIRYAIVKGRPGTPMEAFAGKLGDRDIDDIVSFVRDFKRELEADRGRLPPPTGKEPLVINPDGKPPKFSLRSDRCPKDQPNCTRDPRFVSVAQVNDALAQKRRLVIIDARPTSEWMTVHIAGAVSIPHHALDRLDEIPNDVWAIAYCACPHHLSGVVVDELRKRGHARAAVLDEGILEWHRRGYPIVAAPGVVPPPAERKP